MAVSPDPKMPTAPARGGAKSRESIKAIGAFYTPQIVADFLATWAIRFTEDVVLEPSAGDGVFLGAAARRLAQLGGTNILDHLIGVELLEEEAERARSRVPG